jgi:lipoprotein-releasing system permease protein
MYKLLLCLRYLRTRYIALASIVSVMLGVATMIVVNSVMAGFSTEMRDRIHGILADVIIETNSLDGTNNPEQHMALIRKTAGEYIDGMTATVEVYGMLSFQYGGQYITRPVTLVGIDPEGKAKVGPLVDFLDSYKPIIEDKTVLRPPLRSTSEPPSWNLTAAATLYRKQWMARQQWMLDQRLEDEQMDHEGDMVDPAQVEAKVTPVEHNEDGTAVAEAPNNGAADAPRQAPEFLPEIVPGKHAGPGNHEGIVIQERAKPFTRKPEAADQPETPDPNELFTPRVQPEAADPHGPMDGRLYVGMGLISFPAEDPDGKVRTLLMVRPGDDVKVSTVNAGRPPQAVHFNATVVDIFKSGMSEYDSNLVFCNLEYLQQMRGMVDPTTGSRAVTSIQVKLKHYADSNEVVQRLKSVFPAGVYTVRTWEQKQGPLLAAVEVESAILNVLLFMIIAVAGFGILAIFFMIVVEKTRDIGILKALGASSSGVMSIFLSYGLGLGVVGSGVGVGIGLLFVRYINQIESAITWLTGRKVFDERIYYFPSIPTNVNAMMVLWVALGAIAIAILASILPARRAARLHPVEALRWE